MWEKNKNLVNVLFYFDGSENYARPVRLQWQGVEYELGGVQFWYAEHRGKTLVHHYTLADAAHEYTFELSLETENLTWRLLSATSREEAAHESTGVAVGTVIPLRRSLNGLVGALS